MSHLRRLLLVALVSLIPCAQASADITITTGAAIGPNSNLGSDPYTLSFAYNAAYALYTGSQPSVPASPGANSPFYHSGTAGTPGNFSPLTGYLNPSSLAVVGGSDRAWLGSANPGAFGSAFANETGNSFYPTVAIKATGSSTFTISNLTATVSSANANGSLLGAALTYPQGAFNFEGGSGPVIVVPQTGPALYYDGSAWFNLNGTPYTGIDPTDATPLIGLYGIPDGGAGFTVASGNGLSLQQALNAFGASFGNSPFTITSQYGLSGLSPTNILNPADNTLFVPVPEPATWVVLGAGLVGLVWQRRTRLEKS